MRDRILIYAGLAIFMLLLTWPIWYGVAVNSSSDGPKLARAVGQSACVAPRDYMRKSHMELLQGWRDKKVREGGREYIAADGRRYMVSLSATCLTQCHGSADEFCIRCHTYAGVPSLSCWSCHTSPKKRLQAAATEQPLGAR